MNLQPNDSAHRAKLARFWIWVLVLSQPVLDAVSYWAAELNMSSTLTLGVRMLILAVTVIIAFALSNRKRYYLLTAVILAAFWAAHMLACRRVGYVSPITDKVNASIVDLPPSSKHTRSVVGSYHFRILAPASVRLKNAPLAAVLIKSKPSE